jgi:hypothetical protein
LQGGGATFWQAKNGGFWGSGGVAFARDFVAWKASPVSRTPRPHAYANNKNIFIFIFALICKNYAIIILAELGTLRVHRDEIYNGTVIDIRSLPKGRSPEVINIINCIIFYIISCPSVPRSVHSNSWGITAFPFVRSMGPKTRNVYSRFTRKYAKRAQIPIFWPHGHSMPPRSKNR